MNSITLIEKSGFKINPPKIVFVPFTEEKLQGISTREFGSPYENMDDKIGGNLYLWLQQTNSVLWQISDEDEQVLIFANTVEKLGERFATLMNLPKEEGKAVCIEMVKSLAISAYIIENIFFKMQGNWLLKYRNKELGGTLQYFLFWLTKHELQGNIQANKALDIYIEKFAKNVNLDLFSNYASSEIMEAFIYCFFRGNNETKMLFAKLKNPTYSLNELITIP
jgi:hypothetical protein